MGKRKVENEEAYYAKASEAVNREMPIIRPAELSYGLVVIREKSDQNKGQQ